MTKIKICSTCFSFFQVIPRMKTVNRQLEIRWKSISSQKFAYYNQIAAYHYRRMKTLPKLVLRKIEEN